MSLGSAASLPGFPPQVPLSPTRTVERPFTIFPQGRGSSSPPRRLGLVKAAAEPPEGRVLVVEPDTPTALALQRLLRELNYQIVGPAESAAEAARLLDRIPEHWPIDCAFLDLQVAEGTALAARLRSRDVPLIWIAKGAPRRELPTVPWPAPILRMPTDRDTLLATIRRNARPIGSTVPYVKAPPQEAWPRVFPQL
jgi:CheY-like chemotaxis protein